jgi:aspartate oxidase
MHKEFLKVKVPSGADLEIPLYVVHTLILGSGAAGLNAAENVIFAVGGPGGLYKTSVYPKVHTGGIGLALMAGAKAQNLPES